MISIPSLRGSDSAKSSLMLDQLPVAVMTCTLPDLKVDYVNKRTVELLASIQKELDVDVSNIVGMSIDVFHKQPEYQRRLLSDPANLPHTAVIQLGAQYLELNISALTDARGAYIGPMLTWNIITDKVKADRDSKRLLQMIDKMPINVMTCEPEDFTINYLNSTSQQTLERIQEHLPVKADELMGQTIDVFHKNPSHQRQLLADPANLPHTANIRVGPETLNLRVSAITDDDGSYLGPMLTWSIITDNVRMAESVTNVVQNLSSASAEMEASAGNLTSSSASASEMASSVSAAAEQMTASINEISSRVSEASQNASIAVEEAHGTTQQVETLVAAAGSIGDVTNVINEIAEQTNLLALNATIEAARAGEAGRGFAIVASEVKSLAQRTTAATNQIKDRIEEIQTVSSGAAESIADIVKKIDELNENASHIAAAVEEQTATTGEVAQNIHGVSNAARETGEVAEGLRDTVSEVNTQMETLSREVAEFLENSR